MATFKYLLALVATLALALVFPLAVVADNTLTTDNHPRECRQEDRYCTLESHTRTFESFAKSIASLYEGVSGEDIIRYSGWDDYREDMIVPMRLYAYSIEPNSLVASN
jgi:hypothetical protein